MQKFRKKKCSGKANSQGFIVMAKAGRVDMDRKKLHGQKKSIQTNPATAHLMTLASQTSSKFPAGLFLVSLSSLELMVSTSTQACQSWALATFRCPSAHHILCSHSWAVRHCWRLDAWLPGPQLLDNSFFHFSFLSYSGQFQPLSISSSWSLAHPLHSVQLPHLRRL